MAGGFAWTRRGAARARALRVLLRDTQRALADVADILSVEPDLISTVHSVTHLSSRRTVLVLLGSSGAAMARLLHSVLGQRLLPEHMPRGRRWIRVQFGASTQVHLTLGNSEFELVEELECNKRPWDTIPIEDLLRKEESDLTTILEIELNNQFLKDGLCIVIPPDIPTVPEHSSTLQNLKELHAEFYTKRDLILKNFNPVYLYALDRIGKNIFSDNFCDKKIVPSRSEEDFWSTFNLYYMTRSVKDREEVIESDKVISVQRERDDQPCVFNAENCLDLHQMKELNPNAQIFFVLFSDSVDISERDRQPLERDGDRDFSEATESTEDYRTEELPESDQSFAKNFIRQKELSEAADADKRRRYEEKCAFMNELLDQWELTSAPPSKHSVKTQYLIIDDEEMLQTADQKNPSIAVSLPQSSSKGSAKGKREDRVTKSRTVLLSKVGKFAADTFQTYLLEYATKLSEVHVKLLQQFILSSFDLARELQVVPKKIQYVAKQEQQLYDTMNTKFSGGEKKQELLQIMQDVLQEMKVEVNNMDWSVDDLPYHQDKRFLISNSIFYDSSRLNSESSIRLSQRNPKTKHSPKTESTKAKLESNENELESEIIESGQKGTSDGSDVEEAVSYDSYNFDEFDIIESQEDSLCGSEAFHRRDATNLDETTSESQIGLIHVENESSVLSLNSSFVRLNNDTSSCTNNSQISVKQASLDVQKNVLNKLSKRISLKLTKFVDCLKDTYFGTLQRCLESLESCCRSELPARPVSAAVRQLLAAPRAVELQPSAALALLPALLHALRRLFQRVRIVGGGADGACCVFSPRWRRQTALQTLHSLSPQRLARLICTQILEKLSIAHERYQSALASLETALASRLHHTEDVKLAIRKKYAPSFARLCLESTSMCDLLMYGVPELGREIGRGQYGVVYACRGGWAGRAAAVKSVLPADSRHYRDLAMEFFYTRSIPPHPRIVRLYGSVVSRYGTPGGPGGAGAGAGEAPSVWLVSARRTRDLHAAVRSGLEPAAGLRAALDIVHGIRYLHSLGLVHRDIKMKNVLLDQNDRAALTDLGFCSAEALMSGSVVGTPVHMAPELLTGEYDASVDVYAFAILFWYVCAGSVRLPANFEAFQNKEQLWGKVRKGLRPERLPNFSDSSWDIMESCWASEPAQRAHLGDVQPKLELMLEQALREEKTPSAKVDYESDDSLNTMEFPKHCLL